MMTPDVNVVLLNFPNTGKEMVVANEDGSYTILINAKHSHSTQLKAYEHALKHITSGDFEKQNIQTIEAIAHDTLSVPDDAKRISAKEVPDWLVYLRKERKKVQRQLKKKEKEIAFIREHAPDPDDYYMRAAENYWLYGDNL